MIRRSFIADEGQVMIAADYSQIEMRVLAALSQDEAMTEAILSGVDLHDYTAEKLFGPDFTKAQRKLAKGVGFGKVYGGGAETLSRQTGTGIGDVRRAIQAYDETFRGIKRYSQGLQESAQWGKREVVTRVGRHLPLDRDRVYAATNYVVQSTARDVLAQAVVDLYDKGLGDYLLLPIHDEILGQAPEAEAEEIVHEIKKVMERDFDGIPLLSDAEVYGRTWAHGYGYSEEGQ
jgi:DNA polymerase-1